MERLGVAAVRDFVVGGPVDVVKNGTGQPASGERAKVLDVAARIDFRSHPEMFQQGPARLQAVAGEQSGHPQYNPAKSQGVPGSFRASKRRKVGQPSAGRRSTDKKRGE